MDFDTAFQFVLKFEGGYVNDPNDPGGETKFGISKRAYPSVDIKNLTHSEAKAIYRRDYWDKLRLDQMPDKIRLALFDTAVNSGVTAAIKCLQAALIVEQDGIIGPITRQKLFDACLSNPDQLVADMMWHRFRRVASLDTFQRFGSGWVRRMFNVVSES